MSPYQTRFVRENLNNGRYTLLLGAFSFVVYNLIDPYLHHHVWYVLSLHAVAISTLLISYVLATYYQNFFIKHHPIILTAAGQVSSLVVLTLVTSGRIDKHSEVYFVGLIVTNMFQTILSPLHWKMSFINSLIVIAFYDLTFFFYPATEFEIISSNFFLITAACICGFATRNYQNLMFFGYRQEELLAQEKENASEAKQISEKASAAKSEFLANMSHEIRTPLTGIIGITDLALTRKLQENDRKSFEKIRASGKHLLSLVNDILDFSKEQSMEGHLAVEEVHIEQLVNELTSLVKPNLGKGAFDLLYDIDTSIPVSIFIDKRKLLQVLLNIVGNAVKFTETGSVTVMFSTIYAENDLRYLHVTVKDTGIGMSAEQMDRLFMPFIQADSSISRRFGGTGLGLAVTKRLVDVLGGHLGVRSELHKGSEFWALIPIVIHEERSIYDAYQLEDMPRYAYIVDLSDARRNVMASTLRQMNCQTVTVSSLDELATAYNKTPAPHAHDAVFIVDASMLGVDPLERLRGLTDSLAASDNKFFIVERTHRSEVTTLSFSLIPVQLCFHPLTPWDLYHVMGFGSNPESSDTTKSDSVFDKYLPLFRPYCDHQILLAEDNTLNQEIIVDLLKGVGLEVDAVDNGLMAIERLHSRHIKGDKVSLVLMDIQMPVMDGLTAIRTLRNLREYDDIAIIALTANVLPADAEQCLNAGANLVLTKPINPAILLDSILQRFTAMTRNPAFRPQDYDKVTMANDAILHEIPSLTRGNYKIAFEKLTSGLQQLPGFDIVDGISKCNGKPHLYVQAISTFIHDVQSLTVRLEEATLSSDLKAITQSLHSLRNIAGLVGAIHLKRDMSLTEISVIRHGFTPTIAQEILQLCRHISEVRTVIQDIYESADEAIPADDAPDLHDAERSEALKLELLHHLANSNPQALRLWQAHRAKLVHFPVQLAEFEAALERLDLKLAYQLLSQGR